jgi:acyl dehydratase
MNGPLRPTSVADLEALVGTTVGPSGWQDVTQEKIDAYASLTGDRQWIHTDPVRAAASTFGSTIAHGLFTLSLAPMLMEELVDFGGFARSLNYGYGKVRFPAPLPVDSRVRMSLTFVAVEAAASGIQLTTTESFERAGGAKPVCVAESLGRFFAEES